MSQVLQRLTGWFVGRRRALAKEAARVELAILDMSALDDVAYIFDLWGQHEDVERRMPPPHEVDHRALARDWELLGHDMHRAIIHWEREHQALLTHQATQLPLFGTPQGGRVMAHAERPR